MRTQTLVPSAVLLLTLGAAAQEGQSTFGHARARQLAELGRLPTARDVVVRDIVNHHRHRVPVPTVDTAVSLELRVDRDRLLPGEAYWVQVGYATLPQGDRALAPPCAVALAVDCSGSMQERGKMEQVQRGLAAFVEQLRPTDAVTLIGFASEAHLVAPLRPRGDGRWLSAAIAELRPEGSTNLHAGAMLALEQLRNGDLGDDRARRLILLTDGIANTGTTDPQRIAADVLEAAGGHIDVSTIGVGDNLDTALLKRLADANRGLFHFVGDERDVQQVFVAESDSLLVPVARDVSLSLKLPEHSDLQVVGHPFTERRGGHVEVPLPDLNAGATGVVMVRFRLANRPGRQGDPVGVSAHLRFRSADTGERLGPGAGIPLSPTRPDALPDPLVRKNAAISVLAEGLHSMAVACDARRWADADRELRRALDEAAQLFPGEDEDVQRVRDIATGHERTLRRYVDRFRDH